MKEQGRERDREEEGILHEESFYNKSARNELLPYYK